MPAAAVTSLTLRKVAAATSQHPELPRVRGLYPHTKAPAVAQSLEGKTEFPEVMDTSLAACSCGHPT